MWIPSSWSGPAAVPTALALYREASRLSSRREREHFVEDCQLFLLAPSKLIMAVSRYHTKPLLPPLFLAGILAVIGCGDLEPAKLDHETRAILKEAETALAADQFGVALHLADSAAGRVRNAVEPDFLKGLIYSRLMRWDDADSAYHRVLRLDPGYRGCWNNLGNNAMRQAKYRRAIDYYRQEISIQPASLPWLGLARAYTELPLVDSAAYSFEKAIELDESNVAAYLAYAEVLEEDGEYPRALDLITHAYKLAPQHWEVQLALGSLLLRTDRFAQAVPLLESVTRDAPWHTESHYKLSQALRKVGRVEDSREILKLAENLSARQAEVSAYQKSVGSDPENPYAHAALGTAYRMAGRYEEAVAAYRVALHLEPENFEFLNNLAALHFLRQDTASAIRAYQYILQRDPRQVEVWLNLGVLQALSGHTSNARRSWIEALRHDPENASAHRYLERLGS